MANATLFRDFNVKIQTQSLNIRATLLHDCLQYIRHVDCHARLREHLLYELVATLTSSIFFSTEPSSMAFMALSKPSLRLAAFLLM